MCLLFFAVDQHPGYRLVIAANRDEYYRRPTQSAGFWTDAPHVLAGRDLKQGGTWLGITRNGRWGAVTNYREVNPKQPHGSRGHLLQDYLTGDENAETYIEKLARRADRYAGFNLIVADDSLVVYYSNRGGDPQICGEGVYGLSNHLLDSPWPKLTEGKNRVVELLAHPEDLSPENLFLMLGNRRMTEAGLPDTGVGEELERLLSPAFINNDDFGTRCSTVILIDRNSTVRFIERTYPSSAGRPPSPEKFRAASHRFTIHRL